MAEHSMRTDRQAANGTRPRHLRRPWVALFCASLVLRPPLSALGPLIPRIQHDFNISHALAGLAPAGMLLAMGISSLVAPRIVRPVGWSRTTMWALVLIGLAGLARAGLPSVEAIIVLSIPIGIGAGIAGTALPTAVGDLYREHRAAGTAVHALGINIGATAAAALAVPLALVVGGWRGSLATLGVLALAMSIVWLAGTDKGQEQPRPSVPRLPIRDKSAWILTSLFALQGLCYYGFGAWLADAYVEHGWSQGAGGALVAVLTAAAMPASFVVPRLAERVGSRLQPLFASTVGLVAGAVMLAGWPELAWVGAVVVGLSLGGIFSLCLLLSIDLGRPTRQVAAFAGMMLGLGYSVSGLAPIALGVARDEAGSFSAALWLLVGIATSIVCLVAVAHDHLRPARAPFDTGGLEAAAD
jgi:MFS transporter, CP family, cyanate transporter